LHQSQEVIDMPRGSSAVAAPPPATRHQKGTVQGPPASEPGEGSGAYMRRLMTLGIADSATILAAVHQNFPGSKAKESDVAWNRAKLRKEAESGAPAPKANGGHSLPTAASAPRPIGMKAPAAQQPELPWQQRQAKDTLTKHAQAAERATGQLPADLAGITEFRAALAAGGTSVMITIKGGDRTRAVDGAWLAKLLM